MDPPAFTAYCSLLRCLALALCSGYGSEGLSIRIFRGSFCDPPCVGLDLPLLMHFVYPKTTDYIRNAFLLSLSHLPRTLLMAAITMLPLFFAYVEPLRSAVWLLAIGLSLPAWLKTWLYNSVFKKLEPSDEESEEETEEPAPEAQKKP